MKISFFDFTGLIVLKNNIEKYINHLISNHINNNTIHITREEKDKINSIPSNNSKYDIIIPASGWSLSYPYINKVFVDGITEDMDFQIIGLSHNTTASQDQIKADKNAFGFLIDYNTGVEQNYITFRAYKKPMIDLMVSIKAI